LKRRLYATDSAAADRRRLVYGALSMELRAELIALFRQVVAALSAERLVREACASGRAPRPEASGRLAALGLGKAAAEMLAGARAALGEALEPLAFAVSAGAGGGPLIEGGHPIPDEGSLRAGEALLGAARSLGRNDAVLLLISGGGSSLAEAPKPPLTLQEVRAVNDSLVRSGAPIEEMNCVRAHLSRLKGGGLARALHAAGVRRARALVLVDVPKGGPAAVSSGPAAADPTTYADAREIVRRRSIELPPRAARLLESPASEETLKPGDPADFVEHVVLCDMLAPAQHAARLFTRPSRIGPVVTGPVEELAREYLRAADRPGLFAASGEPELRVPPNAPPGGRAQHLALLMARALRGRSAAFLAAGTDGRDGPTSAAGAAIDGSTWDQAERAGLRPEDALKRYDALSCLNAVGATIPAFHSGAHAGELHLLLCE
jgi:hydroxypyruvate reductase